MVGRAPADDLLNLLPLGLAVLDSDGRCVATNAIFDATVACDCSGDAGILAMAVGSDRERLGATIAELLAGNPGGAEIRLCLAARPDETVLVTLIRAAPIWGFSALIAVRDIREQMRLEQQVAQATKMQAVGQLAGGIAHDFNNILTAVLGLCDQLLLRHPAGSDDFDDLDQLRQNATRAAKVTGQLLAFARQQTLRPEIVDVAAVVAGVAPLLRQLIGPNVDLVVGGEGTVVVRADPGQLEQVLTNLAINARDAMNGRGCLTIAARPVAASDVAALGHAVMPPIDYVALTIADTGPGIAPEIAGKIFEPFFTTKPIGQGTGLGLSTVYGVVKQTGGFVFAEPGHGGGTCFAIYLPASAPVDVDIPAAAAVAPALSGTVLVVEDDRAVRLVVDRALRRAGFGVVAAADGGDALAALEDAAIDVLVSDVVMPGIDGVELLDRVRARRPHLPVVLMSGYAEPPQRRALDGAGAIFLAKPFTADDLIGAVRQAFAARPLDRQ